MATSSDKHGGKCGRFDLLLPNNHHEVQSHNDQLRKLASKRRAVYNLCDKLLPQEYCRGL